MLTQETFHPSWYRAARLRPRLRSHVRFQRHRYRGRIWHVLQDPTSGRCHRLTPAAWGVVGLMDGRRSVQEIWEAVGAELGDEAPTQGSVLRLLGLLHGADLLLSDVSPDLEELFRRSDRRRGQRALQRWLNPLALRIPLVDPDAMLARWLPLVRPLFTRTALAVWAAVIGLASLLALAHGDELTHDLTERLLAPRNLLVLALVYPLLKGLHELGHAFAVKAWGGEVHELGIQVIVGVPVPYVDASAAAAFPEKERRIAVGAAGIAVELFVAALALFVWLHVEPGWLRSLAFDVLWMGGVSSLLFNGNPLLRFDGYYVLADWIEIPNLASRSRSHLSGLVLRHAFGLRSARVPAAARGEAAWLFGYGIASFLYRVAVLLALALFVAGRFFAVGVALALLVLFSQLAVPILRGAAFLLTSPRLGEQRARAAAVCGGATLALGVLVLGVPIPLFTRAEGVVWPPEGSEVRAGAAGFVARVLAAPDTSVAQGTPLLLLRDAAQSARIVELEARVTELSLREQGQRRRDRVRGQMTAEELATARLELARAREERGAWVVRSPADGSFVVAQASDLRGRWIEKGDLIGHVLGPSVASARVVLPQSDVALVRSHTRAVGVRLSGRVGEVVPATIARLVPAASDRLPSRALGSAGGGRLPVDPEDPDGLRTLGTVFQLDLALPESAGVREIGGRVHVRFEHGNEPLALRGWRGVRRLFLSRLGV